MALKLELPLEPGVLRVIAAALASWEAFELLQARLVQDHGFADDPSQKQRLTFKAEGDGAGTTIDLVPFGEDLQVSRRGLLWPPEMDVYMTVSGFEEALGVRRQ